MNKLEHLIDTLNNKISFCTEFLNLRRKVRSVFNSAYKWDEYKHILKVYKKDLLRKVTEEFIPKTGKANHSSAKDYSPIWLSSCLLKVLERAIEYEIRSKLSDNNFNNFTTIAIPKALEFLKLRRCI